MAKEEKKQLTMGIVSGGQGHSLRSQDPVGKYRVCKQR